MAEFRFSKPPSPKPESPKIMFRDLERDSKVKFLWEHQGQLLDEYYKKHRDTKDLAIELFTGGGKTLVSLLIAEYRRRVNDERVVYLCPTRQLCAQVDSHAKRYGIETSLLTGPQQSYDST